MENSGLKYMDVPLIANKNPRYRSEAVKNFQPYALGVEGDWTNLWLER